MIRCHSLHRITRLHHSQWRAVTKDDRPVFVWYKWGELKIYIWPFGGGVENTLDTQPLFDSPIGDSRDCELDWDEVVAATGIDATSDPCPVR